jgi:hypothetical protein
MVRIANLPLFRISHRKWKCENARDRGARRQPPSPGAVSQAGQANQLETERLDTVECAIERGLIQFLSQPRLDAVGFDDEILECLAGSGIQTAPDRDPVAVTRHNASIAGR